MKYQNIREEAIKNKVAQDYFWLHDCTNIIGNVDFSVCLLQSNKEQFEQESLLWAEAKRGSSDIYQSLVQLILTIGKARTFDKQLPPPFLGAFDAEKMAFIPYSDIHEIFYLNDFNWNITPSNYETKEFQLVYEKVKKIIDEKALLFNYLKDDVALKTFIKNNFTVTRGGLSKIKIDKNNFITIYSKWLDAVQPTIIFNWDAAKKNGIISGDFYLADLLSNQNATLKDNLFVVLRATRYEMNRFRDEYGAFTSSSVDFKDKQVAHAQFWNRYERPPKEEYWDYIINRRDLLVPQDVRERKGSFFTPQIWVELSQQYLADTFGEDWQDEYYIWDCAAGTGNLLAGLTNKYNIYASTLDKADVDVMKDRIANGANLLEDHVFQFDFLNDDFTKLPKSLQDIINNEKKRKKLVIYINPPYAEATNRRTYTGKGEHKAKVSSTTKIYDAFTQVVGTATRELYAQFFLRVYKEIPDAKLASFSTLKFVNAPNFFAFRNYFKAEYKNGFICKASSFDNVTGKFPICFLIWNLANKIDINSVSVDAYENDGKILSRKNFFVVEKNRYLIDWFRQFIDRKNNTLGSLRMQGNDVQQHNNISISSIPTENDILKKTYTYITEKNLIGVSIYFTVRQCIKPTWLNNRDQFLYPNDGWKTDLEFQNDCLTYTLFNNNIQSKYGTNHWIPFNQYLLNSRERLASSFMSDFLSGKEDFDLRVEEPPLLFYRKEDLDGGGGGGYDYKKNMKRELSETANAVHQAGLALWKYYHKQPNCNVNASLYDIREYFQGRDDKGKMNNTSDDEKYNELNTHLRAAIKTLAQKIEPKIYEYGFLKK